MANYLIDYPLVSVGQNRILILSDRPHKGPVPYTLDNTPGIIKGQTSDGVPFVFFVEKSRNNISSSVTHAITILASLINIRKELRKGTAVDHLLGWEKHTKHDKHKQGFCQFLNSGFTESARKLLYKTVMSNETLLNLDGIIFKLTRKNGTITLKYSEYPRNGLHAWQGIVDPYGLHSNRDWVKYTLSRNLDKYANITSAEWCHWPKELEPVDVDVYTGYRVVAVKEDKAYG